MSPKRGGLGQGASALFQPSELLSGTGEGVSTLRLSEIEPDKGQPRKNFEPQALNDLADSIAAHGVLQPIVVRPARGGYVIVAGERRWRAARLAGLKEIVPVFEAQEDFSNDALYQTLIGFAKSHEVKNGYVMWPVRTAVSGKQMTPGGASELMEILGKEESVKRLRAAVDKLEAELS